MTVRAKSGRRDAGDPIRIALFASSFHPHTGGVEELVRQLAHAQQRVGLVPTVYTMRWPKSLPASETYEAIPVRRYVFRTPEGGPRRIAGATAGNPATLGRLIESLRRDRCELIHVQCVSSAAWFAVQAARVLRIPLVATLQGELTMDADRVFETSPSARRALRSVLSEASLITACSTHTLVEAESWFGQPFGTRGRVVPNGVRVTDFEEADAHREDRPYLFALGRHVPQKGFDVLLRAMRLRADLGDERLLLLAGDGPQRSALQRLAGELELADRVRFLGITDRPTTASLFKGADAFVLPSRHEPFGIVNLEAMAAGTPVVATDVGGVGDFVVDGRTGLLVGSEDPAGMADALGRLDQDDRLRTELVENGRRCARDHDWSAIERQYRDAYRPLLAPRRPSGGRSAPHAPLRIAFTSLYLPGSSKIGVGHQVHQFANVMQGRGHEITVFSPDQPGEGASYRYHHVDPGSSLRTFRFANRLRSVDWTAFDVLHGHGDDYLLHGRSNPPHLRTMYGSCLSEAIHIHGLKARTRMAALGLTEIAASLSADTTVAISRNTCDWYPWIRRVIPCGVELGRFRPGDKAPTPTLLFVGTYEQRKRGRLLMEVFEREVRPAVPEARLWMVCSDAPAAPGVEVLGRLGDDELADRYRRAWAFCLPSTYEGFGVPYVEAMASGTAVVASPNPGAREVLEQGRLGVIAEDGALGRELIDLLTSPGRRQALADRGLAAAARYDWGAVAAEYESVYADLLARHLDRRRNQDRTSP